MKKMIVILLNGVATAGKDTFAQFCMDYIKKPCDALPSMGAHHMSLIDYDKQTLKERYKWDGNKTPQVRKILADLQMLGMEHNVQIHDVVSKGLEIYDNTGKALTFLFIQARRDKHLELLQLLFLANTDLDVKRNIIVKSVYISRPDALGNASLSEADMEAAHSKFNYDRHIQNDMGLGTLDYKAQYFVDDIIKEVL